MAYIVMAYIVVAYIVMTLQIISAWDVTRTGTVSWSEFEVGCMSIKVGIKYPELQLAWRAMDSNSDGKLDYAEIAAAFAGVPTALTSLLMFPCFL